MKKQSMKTKIVEAVVSDYNNPVSQKIVARRMKRYGYASHSYYESLNELISGGIIKRFGTRGLYLYENHNNAIRAILDEPVDRSKLPASDASGIYAFFVKCPIWDWWILKVGKCTNKAAREKDYRGTIGSIVFQYFRPVPKNRLTKAENATLAFCRDQGWNPNGNTVEQFVIGDDEAKKIAMQRLDEFMIQMPSTYAYTNTKKAHIIDTLDGKQDVRDKRPPCAFMANTPAGIYTKAGYGERPRKIYTYVVPKTPGSVELVEYPTLQACHISQLAWTIRRCTLRDVKIKAKKEKTRSRLDELDERGV